MDICAHSSRRAVSTSAVAGLIVVIVIVAGIAVYYSFANAPVTTVTQTQTQTNVQTTTQTTTQTTVSTKTIATTSSLNLKIAQILTGVISDGSFNLGEYQAVQAMGQLYHVTVAYTEGETSAQCETIMTDYANAGYNLIFTGNSNDATCIASILKQFPALKVAMIGFAPVNGTVVLDENGWDTAYLAGIAAAGASKTGTVGIIAAYSFPTINQIVNAYAMGAKQVNSSIKVLYNFDGSFTDTVLAEEAANTMHSQGADVVYAQTIDTGIIHSAVTNKYFVIGYIVDQNGLAPKNVLTSTLWNFTAEYHDVVRLALNGSWHQAFLSGGYKSGYVSMAPFHGNDANISSAALALYNKAQADLLSGALVITPNSTLPAQGVPSLSPQSSPSVSPGLGSLSGVSLVLMLAVPVEWLAGRRERSE